jgi:integrase
MGRSPLDPGHPGKITTREVRPKVFRARCRFRDLDGVTRGITAQGKSKTAAQNALLLKIKERCGKNGLQDLKPHSRFADAAALWLAQIEQSQRGTTYNAYRTWLVGRVLPDIGEMRLRELRAGYLDAYFTRIRLAHQYEANTLRMIRKVIRGPLRLAIQHEAILYNPLDNITRIAGHPQPPRALTPEERSRFLAWLGASSGDPAERAAQEAARRRDLPDIVRVMLGTGLRIGELMALRWLDLDLEGSPLVVNGELVLVPFVAVTGNVVRVTGNGLVRHAGKTATAKRTFPLPRFAVEVLRQRRSRMPELPQAAPVFCAMTSIGPSWRDPGKVTQWVREVRVWVGLEWMTTHVWRKTAATILDEAGLSAREIANQLGHSQVSITQNVYLGRGGGMNPAAADALDAAFADD